MSTSPLILGDRIRIDQFSLLTRTPRLFSDAELWIDTQQVAWSVAQIRSYRFGVTWLGQGDAFDSFARAQQAQLVEQQSTAMKAADTRQHQRKLANVVRQLRIGPNSERLLLEIHRQVLSSKSSLMHVPDLLFGRAVWGVQRNRWPRHWRQSLLQSLGSLSWIHVAEQTSDQVPPFGASTALLTRVADVRGDEQDFCDDGCPYRDAERHSHFVINIGRGFLGILEQFAKPDDGTGIRTYAFSVGGAPGGDVTLRAIGKTGRAVSIYLPAKLGERGVCSRLTAQQQQLLQAILRETTRAPKRKQRDLGEAEVASGNEVPAPTGRKRICCGFLSSVGDLRPCG